MSRRGYPSSEVYSTRDRDRDYHSDRRDAHTVYAEDVEIHKGRRASENREPDFLREDYARREAGPLVLREEVRERSRERPRRREVLEEDFVVRRGEREREAPRERRVEETDVIVNRGERERPRERKLDRDVYEEREVLYLPRERSANPPPVRSEREEFIFRDQRERDRLLGREEYEYRERSTERRGPLPVRSEREEYVFRGPKIREPSPEPERTEISIRERSKGPPRDRVYDDYEEDDITIRRERGAPLPRGRDNFEEEDLVIRRDRGPPPPRRRDYEEDDIVIRRDERRRPRAQSYERDSLTITESDHDRPRSRSTRGDFRSENQQIVIRREESRPPPRSRAEFDEEIDIRERTGRRDEEFDFHERRSGRDDGFDVRRREPPRHRERSIETQRGEDYENITFKHDNRNGRHKDEIIIRRPQERSPSPEPAPEPPRAPEPVKAPPIVQEVITHHRHIDHGFERAPEPPRSRTPPRAPSPSVHDERIEIRRSGSHNGRHYDDDIIFERETGGRRHLEGVRRSQRPREEEQSRELTVVDTRDQGRRFTAERNKKDRMWTEITRDLVSEEAIKEIGYEYEETEKYYYVMEYLRYEDVLKLVELTEDIKRDRRERIREIQAEREFTGNRRRPLALPPAPPWDEERVVEREIVYDRPPPRRPYH